MNELITTWLRFLIKPLNEIMNLVISMEFSNE